MKFKVNHFLIIGLVSLLAISCSGGRDSAAIPTTQTVPDPGSSPADLNEFDSRIITSTESILSAINARRAEAGVPALISQSELVELAFTRSTNLALRSSMSHEDPTTGKVEVETVLAEMGYAGPAAELLFAVGDPLDTVPERVLEAWFNDPMHKALLLEPTFRYCGVGLMGDGEVWKISMVLTVSLSAEAAQ